MNRERALYLVLLVLALAAPAVAYPVFLMKALCFALFAIAFNLLLGYTGLLSFGHAMFLGTGGYVSGYLMKQGVVTPEIAIAAGALAAAALGALVGSLAIRRQGIYFAMVTLALSQMVYFFYLQAPFTGGEDGLQGLPRGRLFGLIDLERDLSLYYVVLGIFVIGFWVAYRTIHSPFGQVLKSIRENEARALSLGYEVDRYKLVAFVISSGLAGLAGATKTLVLHLASLTDVTWQASGEVVLMTLLGGVGTILGPVVGAFSIVALENYLADLGSWVSVVMGVIFVVCVLAFRRGIVGEIGALIKRSF